MVKHCRGDSPENQGFELECEAISHRTELIFYNLDAVKDEKVVYVVEGEIDALSLHEAGVYNVVSVPNGASKGNQKLEYLDNCWKYFEDKERIVLFTDGDEAGYALREELGRRLGFERCVKVNYPEGCKDANEILIFMVRFSIKSKKSNILPRHLVWKSWKRQQSSGLKTYEKYQIIRFYDLK